MEHFYQSIGPENWFNYEDVYSNVVAKFSSGSLFVEVGSWKGRSSAYMAVEIINSNKQIQFHCIDTWKGSVEHANEDVIKNNNLFDTFMKNVYPVKSIIHPVRCTSVEAASLYENESIDFIMIDACHKYESVKQDIIAWKPKLKKGGIMVGHDYSWDGVKKAVHELLPNAISVSRDCWMIDNN
jgi:predicted O-methyltransferase YrrM